MSAMQVRHDEAAGRFTLPLPGEDAVLDYDVLDGGVREYSHTFVPPAHRGKGYADILVRAALDHARREGWKVLPSCSYVRGYVQRHAEYRDLVAGD